MSIAEAIAEGFKLTNRIIDMRIKRMTKEETNEVLNALQKPEVCKVLDTIWRAGISQRLRDKLCNKAENS